MNYRTFGTALLLSLIVITPVYAQEGLPAFTSALRAILTAIQASTLTAATIGFAIAGGMMFFGRGLEWLNRVFWGSMVLGAAGALASFSMSFG